MSDWIKFICIIVILFSIFISGYSFGQKVDHAAAIKLGLGHYNVDEYGAATFEWNTNVYKGLH
jgi:hypothetical protein